MRASFVRLITRSVLACWFIVIVSVIAYTQSHSWTDQPARAGGVILAFEILTQEPPSERAGRLRELQDHFAIDLALISKAEVEQRIGRRVEPGEKISHRSSPPQEWFFLIFEDGHGALAAGPAHPIVPPGVIPIPAIVAMLCIPLFASLLAFRLERELLKVERASQALATGKLSARVDNAHGPSKELAETFNAMAERVETLIRSRDELVQAVSHELGSPLSRLRFHLELLESDISGPRHARIDAIAGELDALDDLVSELLSYVQSDTRTLNKTRFNPHQGLTDIAELASLEAPDERELEVDVKVPNTVHVLADQRLFLRAIENLLRNAVRYANDQVSLELDEDHTHVHVAVHDDGPGIPKHLRESVLSPFVRLEADRGRTTGGVGLGLAIVSRIIEQHEGILAIETSPLGGALVTTSWPKHT